MFKVVRTNFARLSRYFPGCTTEITNFSSLRYFFVMRRMGQHMQEAKFSEEQQKDFAQLVNRLEPIRELRNHIAHGHMYCRIDDQSHKPTVTVFKAKDLDTGWMPDAKHVEFPELLAALKELNELIEGFQNLAGFKADDHCPT